MIGPTGDPKFFTQRAKCRVIVNDALQQHFEIVVAVQAAAKIGKHPPHFEQLPKSWVELNSVNGSVELTIPSDSSAEIEANTVSGGIDNDFGLRVVNHRFVGHDLRGELGNGGTHIKLNNVNGRIEIRHAEDGRSLSPAKDLGSRDRDDDDDDSTI